MAPQTVCNLSVDCQTDEGKAPEEKDKAFHNMAVLEAQR
jgi:hypothetical protein